CCLLLSLSGTREQRHGTTHQPDPMRSCQTREEHLQGGAFVAFPLSAFGQWTTIEHGEVFRQQDQRGSLPDCVRDQPVGCRQVIVQICRTDHLDYCYLVFTHGSPFASPFRERMGWSPGQASPEDSRQGREPHRSTRCSGGYRRPV